MSKSQVRRLVEMAQPQKMRDALNSAIRSLEVMAAQETPYQHHAECESREGRDYECDCASVWANEALFEIMGILQRSAP